MFWLVRALVRRARSGRRIDQPRRSGRRRVLVLTAPIGEGHITAAAALVAELEAEDPELEIVLADALDDMGRVLRFILCDLYRWQFGHGARFYGLLYRMLERVSFFRRIGELTITGFGSRPLLRMVKRHDPDLIVSTNPPVTCVLGHLRRRERIRVPVVATITDLDGLAFWVHPGADLHLVVHESCIEAVERLAGPGSARCARPLIGPAFYRPTSRDEARRALGLPESGSIAVVSGGGWGVGELEEATRAALAIEDLSVICLAGKNEAARKRLELAFASQNRVAVWGFIDRMSDLLAAADVLVHSTGGVTVLEALARGCPVIAYGAPPGHARLTAEALARQNLGWIARPGELTASLRSALELPRACSQAVSSLPSCASLALAVTMRSPALAWRSSLRRRVALAGAAFLLPVWVLSTDLPYSLTASALGVAPVRLVTTSQARVGLVIEAPPALVPALESDLARRGAHASFAFAAPVDSRLLGSIARAQDEPLPALGSGEPMGWIRTRDQLQDLRAALRAPDGRYYLAPPELTFGEYLLGRGQGALPIAGFRFASGSSMPADGFQRGDVIILDLPGSGSDARAGLDRMLGAIDRSGLGATSLEQLLASSSARAAR